MKRVLFSMVLLLAAGFTFAQEKSVKEAKSIANDVKPDFAQAEKLINEALNNAETKDNAETWDVAGFIQKRINEKEMENAYLRKPYDTLKVYNSALNMCKYYFKCDELAQIPNEKGKIKNKFRRSNSAAILAARPNLINGGIQFFNLDKNKEALDFFATYVDIAINPMFEKENLLQTDTVLPQIAYYASLAAAKMEDYLTLYESCAEDRNNPYFSPLMEKDYTNLPDTLILTAEFDPLRDEGEEYGKRLKEAGNYVEIHRVSDALHGYFALGIRFLHVQESFDIMNRFLSKGSE